MTGAGFARVASKDQPLKLGAKTVSELLGEDVTIEWDGGTGKVSGELKHVESWPEFSGIQEEQSGNYFPAVLGPEYSGKPVTVQRNGGQPKTVVDRVWILRVPSKDTVFTFSADGLPGTALDFSGSTLGQASEAV